MRISERTIAVIKTRKLVDAILLAATVRASTTAVTWSSHTAPLRHCRVTARRVVAGSSNSRTIVIVLLVASCYLTRLVVVVNEAQLEAKLLARAVRVGV